MGPFAIASPSPAKNFLGAFNHTALYLLTDIFHFPTVSTRVSNAVALLSKLRLIGYFILSFASLLYKPRYSHRFFRNLKTTFNKFRHGDSLTLKLIVPYAKRQKFSIVKPLMHLSNTSVRFRDHSPIEIFWIITSITYEILCLLFQFDDWRTSTSANSW